MAIGAPAVRACVCGKYDVCFRLSMTGECPKAAHIGSSDDDAENPPSGQ